MMKNLTSIVLGLLLATLTCGTIARAAAPSNYHPWALDTGPTFRTGSLDSDFGFSSPWALGLHYYFKHDYSCIECAMEDAFFDFYSSTDDGHHTSAWGLGIAISTPQQLYVGGGLGYYGLNNGGSTISGLGGKIFSGYSFEKRIQGGPYLQVDYTYFPQRGGVNNNLFGVRIGDRF
jgi:hypothetical protein